MKFLFAALAFLAGCASPAVEWPGESQARDHFVRHWGLIESIATRFDAEPDLRSIERSTDSEVVVSRGDDRAFTRVPDAQLASGLREAGICSIRRDNAMLDFGLLFGFALEADSQVLGYEEIHYDLSFLRSGREYPEPYARCPKKLPPHFEGSYGRCAISLGGRWFILYFWKSA